MIWLLDGKGALGLTVSAQQRGKRFGLPAEIWPVELLPDPEGSFMDELLICEPISEPIRLTANPYSL